MEKHPGIRRSQNKLELQCQLQEQLMRSGAVQTDCPLRNETGELVSQGEDGLFYVVREWHPGKECDTRSIPEIRRAASAMARLHKAACLPLQKEYEKESLISECVRHNAEIRKIKKYISKKQKKNTFEKLLLGSADEFLEQGEAAVEELKQSDYEQLREQARQRGNICHGEFNQHNILFSGGQDIVIHFDKWNFDLPEADLYHFMRKILEKHSWDLQIGSEILAAYEKVQPLQASERQNLRLRLSVVVRRAIRQLAIYIVIVAEYDLRDFRVEFQITGKGLIRQASLRYPVILPPVNSV